VKLRVNTGLVDYYPGVSIWILCQYRLVNTGMSIQVCQYRCFNAFCVNTGVSIHSVSSIQVWYYLVVSIWVLGTASVLIAYSIMDALYLNKNRWDHLCNEDYFGLNYKGNLSVNPFALPKGGANDIAKVDPYCPWVRMIW